MDFCIDHLIVICDPFFWRTILIFGKAQKVTKTASPATKMIFFTKIIFFSRVHTLHSCFLQKTHSFWSSIASRALCKKKNAYRGSPPCTIFLTSRGKRNKVQLCTTAPIPYYLQSILFILPIHCYLICGFYRGLHYNLWYYWCFQQRCY